MADFSYDRKWLMRSSLFLAVAVVWVMLLIVLLLPFDPLMTVLMGLAMAAFVLVVGISPFLTKHSVDERGIVLRQGWHFTAHVPLDNVKAINFIDEVPKDRGRFIYKSRGTLNVTASKSGLVSLQLRRPQRFASVFWRRADELVFDVVDREGFRKALENALVTTPASPDRAS